MNRNNLLVAIFCIISLFSIYMVNRNKKINTIDIKTYQVGYQKMDNRKYFIKSYDEFKSFLDIFNGDEVYPNTFKRFSKSYSKGYFNNKSLAILYVETESSAYTVFCKDYQIEDSIIHIDYDWNVPNGIYASDRSGYLVVLEVPKSVTGIK